MKKQVDFNGALISGTLREEHLIPAFSEVLAAYWPEKAEELKKEYAIVYDALGEGRPLEGDVAFLAGRE